MRRLILLFCYTISLLLSGCATTTLRKADQNLIDISNLLVHLLQDTQFHLTPITTNPPSKLQQQDQQLKLQKLKDAYLLTFSEEIKLNVNKCVDANSSFQLLSLHFIAQKLDNQLESDLNALGYSGYLYTIDNSNAKLRMPAFVLLLKQHFDKGIALRDQYRRWN